MRTLSQQLAMYAAYHRHRANVATHLVGIPLIVIAVTVLLSRPGWSLSVIVVSPALIAVVAVLAYYFLLDVGLALVMAFLLALSLWFGAWCAAQSTLTWLSIGVGAFVIGWALQLVGHAFEGRKPAFLDDIMGLLIGPLFVVVEMLSFAGVRKNPGKVQE
ncbi:MAG TPA: Mpo1-like protein [Casimicrobiaceae bacterium]|nr:Mpo1-like protein [Casimicrobiaceae bacterium]